MIIGYSQVLFIMLSAYRLWFNIESNVIYLCFACLEQCSYNLYVNVKNINSLRPTYEKAGLTFIFLYSSFHLI